MPSTGSTQWANAALPVDSVPSASEAVIGTLEVGLTEPWADCIYLRGWACMQMDADAESWQLKLRRGSLSGPVIGVPAVFAPATPGDVGFTTLAVEAVDRPGNGGTFTYVLTSTQDVASGAQSVSGVVVSAVCAPNLVASP